MSKFVFNEAMKLRRKTIIEMAKLFEKDELEKSLAKLPKKILGDKAIYRSSIYHEREILKQRIKLYLGLDYSKSKDYELFEISDDLEKILDGESDLLSDKKFIHIIDEACDLCPDNKYYITDLCRNCVAHSCKNVCPKNAISMENGRMKIDDNLCVSCGLCEKVCHYQAVVKLKRPCVSSCNLGAIKSIEKSPVIDETKCVSCGTCYKNCPFGAIETPLNFMQVLKSIKKKEKIVAIIAPSIEAQFGMKVSIGKLKSAIKKIGFDDCVEAAIGADEVSKEEAEYIEKIDKMTTTSCCPAFVECIEKHYPEYIDNISPALSPMSFLAKKMKEKEPERKLVFIGPCIAKKMEAKKYKDIDFVMSFEELGALFIAKKIEPSEQEEDNIKGSSFGWKFAMSGGVTEAVKNDIAGKKDIKVISMNGLSQAKSVFDSLKNEEVDLFEGMACDNGCIGGPGIIIDPKIARAKLNLYKK